MRPQRKKWSAPQSKSWNAKVTSCFCATRLQNALGLRDDFRADTVAGDHRDREGLHGSEPNCSRNLYWEQMTQDFLRVPLGKIGTPVCRIGLSATYRPGRETIFKALDEGLNYFFFFGFDTQMTSVLRETLLGRRDQYVLATGAYNYIWRAPESAHDPGAPAAPDCAPTTSTSSISWESRGARTSPRRCATNCRPMRESGLVRGVSISTHDRKFAAELAREGALDAMMIRYNAAHVGAETEIFPHLPESDPAVISFTATRWTSLLRAPKGYPRRERVPTAGTVLSVRAVEPGGRRLPDGAGKSEAVPAEPREIRQGPLPEDEMKFIRHFGDIVYGRKQYFM